MSYLVKSGQTNGINSEVFYIQLAKDNEPTLLELQSENMWKRKILGGQCRVRSLGLHLSESCRLWDFILNSYSHEQTFFWGCLVTRSHYLRHTRWFRSFFGGFFNRAGVKPGLLGWNSSFLSLYHTDSHLERNIQSSNIGSQGGHEVSITLSDHCLCQYCTSLLLYIKP